MLRKLYSAFGKSVLLCFVVLPYLIDSTINISFSLAFIWLALSLILFEIGYQKLTRFLFNKFKIDINFFVIPTIILIFYYGTFIILIDYLNSISVKHPIIRARYSLPVIWILLIVFYYYIRPKIKGRVIVIHSFLFIFSIVLYISPLVKSHQSEPPVVSHFIELNNSYTKPVILLVLDEYSSPKELLKNNQDTSLLKFSNLLTSSGWSVNNTQFSNDISTINSLSSLFNYNLKLPKDRINNDQAINELRGAYLISDLKKKGVKFHNFGIFDIGESNAFSKILFYEKEQQKSNSLWQIFEKSLFRFLYDTLPAERLLQHNKFLVENGYKIIKPLAGKKVFIYIHLLMPHSPFAYEGENKFELSGNLNNVESYKKYWHFTNNLVKMKLLDSLVQSKAFKIILTGDHGYRGESEKVNPHKTMTAYYGFEKSQIVKINSVQDLGSLIYASY